MLEEFNFLSLISLIGLVKFLCFGLFESFDSFNSFFYGGLLFLNLLLLVVKFMLQRKVKQEHFRLCWWLDWLRSWFKCFGSNNLVGLCTLFRQGWSKVSFFTEKNKLVIVAGYFLLFVGL